MIRWIIFFLRLTVIDAALAGAAEQGEGAGVCLKDHLLGFAREGADERHPAVAEPDVRDLHPGGHAR